MTEIKIYWCGKCSNLRSTRKEVRKHLREIHGVKGISMKGNEDGSSVSASTMSEVLK